MTSLRGATERHSLAHLLSPTTEQPSPQEQPKPALVLKRFAQRVRYSSRGHNQYTDKGIRAAILADPAVRNYMNYLRGVRGNNGQLSDGTISHLVGSVWNFLDYIGIPVTDHAIADLVAFKEDNPKNMDIERALNDLAMHEPRYIRSNSQRASAILSIFNRGNFVTLKTRINTHFEPITKENCNWTTFLQIYARLTPQQQAMVQWGLYVPQRSVAAYTMPLDRIDLTTVADAGYALVTIEPTVGINKARVRHPCFPPIAFAKAIVEAAKAARRTCPFPDHRSEWKKITALAKNEFGAHLTSKNLRKYFESRANKAHLRADFAAFLMGDKTKLAATGHIPSVYNPDLMEAFWDEMVQDITNSGITDLLTLPAAGDERTSPLTP